MGFIYKITNLINGKLYVGKTEISIERRWRIHCSDSTKRNFEKRPLYDAIKKYGKENFSIEQIEECESNILAEREIFWIDSYGTYKDGYNATLGGEGKRLFNYELICDYFKENPQTPNQLAEYFHCSIDTIRSALETQNLKVKPGYETARERLSIPIVQYSKEGVYLRDFPSAAEAARWLEDNGYLSGNLSGVRTHIRDVINGKRKTAHGFIWKDLI